MNSKQLTYRPYIDGLRAIAVMSVVIHHAFPGYLTSGFVGVDVFFVISGYLISSILFKDISNGNLSFKNFYSKRIKRIFPALITVLVFCIVFGWFFLLPQEYKVLGKHILSSAVFIQNFTLAGEVGYFADSANLKPLLHLWSLGIEEQFYIVFPLFLYVVSKFKDRVLFTISILAVLSFVFCIASLEHTYDYFMPHVRAWELLFGSILAYVQMVWKPNVHQWKITEETIVFVATFSTLLGLSLIVLACNYDNGSEWLGGWYLVPIVGAGLIIVSGKYSLVNQYLLSSRIFVYIGLISYPLYLWHWPILSFAHILIYPEPSTELLLLLIVVSMVLASVTYHFIEEPFRFKGFTFFSLSPLAILIYAMLIVTTMGLYVYTSNGIETRFDEKVLFNDKASHKDIKKQDCRNELRGIEGVKCSGSNHENPEYIVLGDSHAEHYDLGFKALGKSYLIVYKPDCAPFWKVEVHLKDKSKHCIEAMEHILNYGIKHSTSSLVILSARWPMYYWGEASMKKSYSEYVSYETDGVKNSIVFERAIEKTLKKLSSIKNNIVIFQSVPELDFRPENCSSKRPVVMSQFIKTPCGVGLSFFRERSRSAGQIISDQAEKYSNIHLLNPSKYLCNTELCTAELEGMPLYYDNNHLNEAGATHIIRQFQAELDELN